MSDSRLRDAERRWRDSGRVEDEAAWLRERARVGELDEGRLRLAALVGHPASQLAVGANDPLPRRLPDWIDREPWVIEACLRAMIPAVRCALRVIEVELPRRANAWRHIVANAERWTLGMEERRSHVMPSAVPSEASDAARCAEWAAASLRDAVETLDAGRSTFLPRPTTARLAASDAIGKAMDALGAAAPVAEAVRADVAPWALGDRDPLRERVGG